MDFKKCKGGCGAKINYGDICNDCQLCESSRSAPGSTAEEFHKNCNDCGQFVPKRRWIPKNTPNNERPLCMDCWCLYDTGYESY